MGNWTVGPLHPTQAQVSAATRQDATHHRKHGKVEERLPRLAILEVPFNPE